MPEPSTRERLIDRWDLLLFALVAIAGTYAFANSSGRWLDPVIDTGRDLSIPAQVRGGTALYRDVLYYYPPLTPYLLAAATALVGDSLSSYTAIGVAISLVVALALYLTAKVLVHRLAGLAAALLFVGLSFTGASTWGANFIFPYAHAATIGMMFLLLQICFLAVYFFRERAGRWLAIGTAFGLLAAWSKIELAAIALAYFGRDLIDNAFPASLLRGRSSSFFYSAVQGRTRLGEFLVASLLGGLTIALVALVIALIDRSKSRKAVGGLLALLALLTFFAADDRFFAAWAIAQVALVPFALREPRSPLFFLLLFSMGATLRIYFNLSPNWYGFTLMLPLFLLIAFVLFRFLPERGAYSERAAWLWLPLLLLLMGRGLALQRMTFALKTHRIETARGVFYDVPGRGAVIESLLRGIAESRAKSLVVFPEGLTINYLSGVPTPLSFHTFTPIEAADPDVEHRILQELTERKPELVAIVTRDVSEFGYRGFGIDYHLGIRDFLRANYRPIGRWSSPSFKAMLLHSRN
ncbi:MAG TPA: glycosyltransferase family 39 protein [Thermoanaerobaculia bacterium]